MSVGVVEDDPRHARVVSQYLERYALQHGHEVTTRFFPDGSQILESYRPDYDILLLDIQMAETDGLATARRIRQTDPSVVIIFITSAPQYAINGYEVAALGFLLKPVPYEAFSHEMDRAMRLLERRERKSLVVRDAKGVQRLPVSEIVYLESVGHRLDIHMVGSLVSLSATLKEMEPRLETLGFYRSNSCYIVNLQHVVGMREQDCLMTSGDRLRVSRPRKKGFMQALTEHVAGTDA